MSAEIKIIPAYPDGDPCRIITRKLDGKNQVLTVKNIYKKRTYTNTWSGPQEDAEYVVANLDRIAHGWVEYSRA